MRKYIIVLVVLLTSCNSWLDLTPEDDRVSTQYWKTKDDVQATLLSGYTRFRSCLPYFLIWGEIRAENLSVVSLDATSDIELIGGQNITSMNDWIKWQHFYKVINSANSVIKYAPVVLERDQQYSEEEMVKHVAEARAIRGLAYYYLVRAFREVPLVLEPYDSDDAQFTKPKSPEAEIWKVIVEDLEAGIQAPKKYSDSERWQNVGRITQNGAVTILAEVCLWTGDYKRAKELCETIINSKDFELQSNWFNVFYPGMTTESIFELYYEHASGQTNSLFSWFNFDNSNHHYNINSQLVEEFDAEDLRGEGGTFVSAKNGMWKYLGNGAANSDANNLRPSTRRSANWMFYRYADIYLIHAEACGMMESPDYARGIASINEIRGRAGISLLETDGSYTQQSFLSLLLEERKREFVGEGKRWFDLLRLARIERFSKFKTMVVNILLKSVSLNERPIYQTKLSKEGSFYFPIYIDEINMSGGVLTQNEAYQ
ncbi:MAG: RagB/SusD family nutrient uptake outer membrane protein [Marinifilaceae bacterium]